MTSISLLRKEIAMSSVSEASWQLRASNFFQNLTSNVVLLANPQRIPVVIASSLCRIDRIPSIPAALEPRYKSDSSSTPRSDFSLISPAYIASVDQI
ncbi:hypothetical protein B9Z55_009875 [Caenorhabditis nigoni]|uniref:Uncharacterized protein n=1 Tax=Caenorhabditis nigoni TaxID=1611254 RepID=A0A2G5UTY3_9PELO|nr:hypothetical protein B9Z55_009875 [Caenorhabditis nigoni]